MDKERNISRIIISGGGTGGHIFPAIAIANALKEINQEIEILFIGADNRMEMQRVPAAGYNIIGLPVAGFNRRNIFKNFEVIAKLFKSLIQVNKIINNFKPHIVVGVGGYASGPTLIAASLKGISVVIQEQNSYAGITNKILSKRASKIFVAFNGMDKYFPHKKIIMLGNPVRQDIKSIENKRDDALKYFELENDKIVILVLGGSLGAKTINLSVSISLEKIGLNNVQVIWQSGEYYFEDARKKLKNEKIKNVKLHAFISRMDMAYAAADIIISRAGASSISELCIVGKPVILIPSPNVAEDHQTKNAQALVNKNAAILIQDSKAQDRLFIKVFELIADNPLRKSLSENISKLALYNSAENIAKEILKIINP